MYFGTGPDVADLSLYQDGRIDCFEGFDRIFRPSKEPNQRC
jgi:hypothetical protein